MADIQIERKERSLWPWVIAVLLLLALMAWWLGSRGGERAAMAPADSAVESMMATGDAGAELPGAVNVFLRWANDRQAGDMGLDHNYTANGIRNLAAATEALAAPRADALQQDLERVRAQADTLWQSTSSLEHANYTRRAFMTLGSLLHDVQQQRAPDATVDVAAVRSAAEAVRANQPLLDQKERVHQFFAHAATAVEQLANELGG